MKSHARRSSEGSQAAAEPRNAHTKRSGRAALADIVTTRSEQDAVSDRIWAILEAHLEGRFDFESSPGVKDTQEAMHRVAGADASQGQDWPAADEPSALRLFDDSPRGAISVPGVGSGMICKRHAGEHLGGRAEHSASFAVHRDARHRLNGSESQAQLMMTGELGGPNVCHTVRKGGFEAKKQDEIETKSGASESSDSDDSERERLKSVVVDGPPKY